MQNKFWKPGETLFCRDRDASLSQTFNTGKALKALFDKN